MKQEITQRDLENPQRYVGEGLGAPEACIREANVGVRRMEKLPMYEDNAQRSAGRLHLCKV